MLKKWISGLFRHGARNDDFRPELKPYLDDDNACTLLRLILENPGITIDRLAQRSQIDYAVIKAHVHGFVASGLVIPEKEGDRTGYHITNAAKAAVVEGLPLNYQCPGMMRE